MTSGCYVLRLECDMHYLPGDSTDLRCGTIADFNGEDIKDAIRVARESGWRVEGSACWCKRHAKRTNKQLKRDVTLAWRET